MKKIVLIVSLMATFLLASDLEYQVFVTNTANIEPKESDTVKEVFVGDKESYYKEYIENSKNLENATGEGLKSALNSAVTKDLMAGDFSNMAKGGLAAFAVKFVIDKAVDASRADYEYYLIEDVYRDDKPITRVISMLVIETTIDKEKIKKFIKKGQK